jgi:glucose/arabinose dehydrogenase
MRRWLARALLGSVVVFGATCAACRWLLPERFAVNAPMTNTLFGWGAGAPAPEVLGSRIRVPDGFSIAVWAEVPRARMLRATRAGDLLVSVPREGRVVLVSRDGDGDGRPDGQRALLEGLDRPHGLDLHDGWLWVAEGGAIGRVPFDAESGTTRGAFERVVTGLPEGGNHWTRTVRVGPDGLLYVTVGSSCNACLEEDPRRAAMLRYRRDGSGEEIYARGLRNAVGFDWRPGTGELYATDNGRDLLGDDFPPCELDRIVRGGDYGWPVANGDRRLDPDVGAGYEARAQASLPPAHAFAAHNAPLGIHFLRGPRLPEEWRGVALVALHGSWNRTRKDGYKVVSLHFGPDGAIEERDFVWGFLEDEDVIGRPVDATEGPDGSIFVSDDYAGAVYRVTRGGAAAAATAAPQPARTAAADPLAALAPAERENAARRGELLFEAHRCARCHVPERAEPGVVPMPLAGLARRYDLAGLSAFLAAPTPPMPPVAADASERRDLAVFLLSRF